MWKEIRTKLKTDFPIKKVKVHSWKNVKVKSEQIFGLI